MRRSSSIIARRTHSSSVSRQAQMLPIISSTVIPQPLPSPGVRSSSKSPGTPNTEKVKEWVDIFDGPMRPSAFVTPTSASTSPPSSATMRETDTGIIFDGPARPRYIIPGARIHSQTISSTLNQNRNGSGSPSTTQRRDVSELLSRSSLPPPRIYDGPAFEWELQTKRV